MIGQISTCFIDCSTSCRCTDLCRITVIFTSQPSCIFTAFDLFWCFDCYIVTLTADFSFCCDFLRTDLIIPLCSIRDLCIHHIRIFHGCFYKIVFPRCKVCTLSTIDCITDAVWKFFFLPADQILSIKILDFCFFRDIIRCLGIIHIIIIDCPGCTLISCLVNNDHLDLERLIRNSLTDWQFDRCLRGCSAKVCSFCIGCCIIYFVFDIRQVGIFSCYLKYRTGLTRWTCCCLSRGHLRITCKGRRCPVDRKLGSFSIPFDVSIIHATDYDLVISIRPVTSTDVDVRRSTGCCSDLGRIRISNIIRVIFFSICHRCDAVFNPV